MVSGLPLEGFGLSTRVSGPVTAAMGMWGQCRIGPDSAAGCEASLLAYIFSKV